MAAPARTSYIVSNSSTTTNTVDLTSLSVGSWMLAIYEIGTTGLTITPPSGWTSLMPVSASQVQSFGTRVFAMYGRIKQSGDTTFTWTLSSAVATTLSVMWGTGAQPVNNWGIGTIGVRGAGDVVAGQSTVAGTGTTTVAPSITTTQADCLVLAINMEATIATETAPSSYTGGTEWFWSGTTATYIESAHVLYNVKPTIGTVGSVTTTYPNTQASNGAGLQISIPSSATTIVTPVIVGSPSYGESNGTVSTSLVITKPSTGVTLQDGDMLIASLRSGSSSQTTDYSSSGWTRFGSPFAPSSPGARVTGLFVHFVSSAASEPSSYTFTLAGNAFARQTGMIIVIRHGSGAIPWSSQPNIIGNTSYTSPSNNAVANNFTASDHSLVIYGMGSEFVSPNALTAWSMTAGITTIGQHGSLTNQSDTSATRSTAFMAYQQITTGGVQSSRTFTPTSTSNTSHFISAIVIPGSGGYVPPGVAVKMGDSSAAYLTYLDAGGTRVSPLPLRIWYPSYTSVNALLADISRHPTSAHRGGSAVYPEFSEYGYDHAVTFGHAMLEFSCGWTSDLVPFGLASQYLDTAAGLAGGTNLDPTTITWATLSSTYQNKLLPVSPGVYQPFYRLVDFLTKYTPTHIVTIDPKFGFATTAKVNAMLDICDAHGGPTRIIIKFDSPTTNTVLTAAAHSRGYKCMNYWGTDITSLSSQQSNWDILGYAYNGSPSDWSTVLGYGKPTWAAVIPNTAGVTTATSSGAGIMMITDVATIKAVSSWNA